MSSDKEVKKVPLSFEDSVHRRKVLSTESGTADIHYDLILVIRRKDNESKHHAKNQFAGQVKVKFYYTEGSLFIDYVWDIISVHQNGEKVEIKHTDHKLHLDESKLKKHSYNEVTILFHSTYTKTSQGLHYYLDTIDGNEYLYTQFEPFDCHKMFPVFDQPDLKARLDLNLVGSSDWVMLGNEREKWSKEINEETLKDIDFKGFLENYKEEVISHLFGDLLTQKYSLTVFYTTPKISSYLYAIAAGPYHVEHNTVDYPVALRVFQRKSLKKFGDATEFFKITMAGMEWYKDYFGIAYPFSKYDQIYSPEYNWGAMENVGLVTYNELYLWRDKPNFLRKSRFCITVLHELAHMWFGNLVTMRWWNDLWLNESFATFISFLCQSECLPDYQEKSWMIFNNSRSPAYNADQQSTTHPVMCEVKNTEVAETHFDALVYYKGSSFLKQLFKFIGRENFSKGLKAYFATYKWTNTVFSDFINKLAEACGNDFKYDLVGISESWLKKAGLNELEIDLKSENGKVVSFDILQKPSLAEYNNPQKYLFDIIAFRGHDSVVYRNVEVNASERTSIDLLVGTNEADAYLLNYGDFAFFKWVIDRKSLNYFKNPENISKLDPLSKALFYFALYNLTRDSRMSSIEYLQIIKDLIVHETDDYIVSTVLSTLEGIVSSYIPFDLFPKYSQILFDLYLVLLRNKELTEDTVKTLLSLIISNSENASQVDFIRTWLEKGPYITLENNEIQEFNNTLLNQDMRFSIIFEIYKHSHISLEEKKALLDREIERDKNSDRSVRARFRCESSLPDKEKKSEIWNKIVHHSSSETLHNMISMMNGFSHRNQIGLVEDFINGKFYTDIVTVCKNNEHFFSGAFINSCGPGYFVNEETISKLDKVADENKDIDTLHRKIKEKADNMRRFLKAHKLCYEYLGNN